MIEKSAIAAAVALALGTGYSYAGPMTSATFTMLDGTGGTVGVDPTVTGAIGGGVWSVTSTTPFFGQNWTAHDGVTFGPGTYSFDTIQGGIYTGVVVGAGQVGGQILFDWGVTTDIDVVNVWDEDCVIKPTFLECTYTSTDGPASNPVNPDGIRGYGMIDGAFPTFNANFDFVATFPLPGAPTFTPPADVDTINDTVTATPADVQVALGTVTDEDPPTATVEYSIDGLPIDAPNKDWKEDDGINIIIFTLTETVNDLIVDWRADDVGGTTSATQNVRVTIDDTVAPDITGTPANAVVDVTSTDETVCFAGTDTPWGMLTAIDAIDPDPTIEYSLDNFEFTVADTALNCSNQFEPGDNTVYWQASDKAVPEPNVSSYEQMVTLNLPTGIIGKPCTTNLDYAGFRNLEGTFIMRDPTGALVGVADETVTGEIDTTLICTDSTPGACADVGAALETTQPFQGLLWTSFPVQLYGVGDWAFDPCPGDNSINCPPPGTTLDLTVLSPENNVNNPGIEQLGAHMLFAWGTTKDIDVVVAWDVDCGAAQLTTTDPDGDGILGTKMIDGPFQGFNAAFDVSATGVDSDGNPVPLIADGGYVTSIPAYKNPVQGESPLPLDFEQLGEDDFPKDPKAGQSCIGGCYAFETDGLIDDTDDDGDYQYVQVVFPLDVAIPFWSLYRKFDEASQTWITMVPDNRNNVKTALKDDAGFCPEPGAGDYKQADANSQLEYKLEENTACVQLTIENNGPYDSNPAADKVADPSGVLQVPAPSRPDAKTTGDGAGGGCSIASNRVEPAQRGEWWLLGGLLAFMGWRRRKQQH